MNTSDNGTGGGSSDKLDQLQKELDELEKKAFEEINKGTKNKFNPQYRTEQIPPSVERPTIESSPTDTSITPEAPENLHASETPDDEKKVLPEIHVQPNPEAPKKTLDINSGRTAKTLMIVGIVLFVICLLSIGAYFLATREGSNVVVTTAPTPVAPIATPNETSTPEPESVKNTYINNNCGFKISYPALWTVEKDNQTGFVTLESEDFSGTISEVDYKINTGQGLGISCDQSVDADLVNSSTDSLKCEENSNDGFTCERLTFGGLVTVNNEKFKYMGLHEGALYTFVFFDPSAEVNEILNSFELNEPPDASNEPPPTPLE